MRVLIKEYIRFKRRFYEVLSTLAQVVAECSANRTPTAQLRHFQLARELLRIHFFRIKPKQEKIDLMNVEKASH